MKNIYMFLLFMSMIMLCAVNAIGESSLDSLGLEEAISFIRQGRYEQARSRLIPYLKYCPDGRLSNTAGAIFSLTYFYENNTGLSLCILMPLLEKELDENMKISIYPFIEEMADSLRDKKDEALKLALFILENAPERQNAFFRVGYILLTLFDDRERALYYFNRGLRDYPSRNIKAQDFIGS